MPVSKGAKALAADYNAVRDLYNEYWSDIHTTSAFADADKTNHKKGWGQASVKVDASGNTAVTQSSVVESQHINRLIAQVNTGYYHTDETATLNNQYVAGTVILDTHLNEVETDVNAIISDQYGLNTVDRIYSPSEITISSGLTWGGSGGDGIYCVGKYSFTNYTQARYFFNAGGVLTLDPSSTQVGSVDEAWDDLFTLVGEIHVRAIDVLGTGTSPGTNSGGGFYDLTTTDAILWSFAGGSAYSYTYGGRRLEILARGDEPSGAGNQFDVYVTFKLFDDTTEVNSTDDQIDLDMGYIVPDESPDPTVMSTSASQYFQTTHNSVTDDYVFQAREEPTLVQETAWTAF